MKGLVSTLFSPALQRLWSVTPHRWCRQAKRLRLLHKNKGRTAKRPIQTGACTCCLLRDEVESSSWDYCTIQDNYKDNPLISGFNLKAPCTRMTPSPRPYLAIPDSACPLLKWAPRQLALVLPSLMARLSQGCRSSDTWERDVFFYMYWRVKRLTKHRGVVLTQANPHHGLFKNISH